MKKILSLTLFALFILFVWYGESRKFFCLQNGQCVTVWKTYNGICYIIPGSYYGLIKPSSRNYIRTSNSSDLDIICQADSHDIIANADESAKIVNQSPEYAKIINYNVNKNYNDSLFTYFDGKYHRYKKTTVRMTIFVKENYAVDKEGKQL